MSKRLHRLRSTRARRDLFSEVHLTPGSLCLPIFVHDLDEETPVASLPGVVRHPISALPALSKSIVAAGIRSVLVFGIPSQKSADGAADPDGPGPRGIAEVKQAVGDDLVVIADTCLCSYREDGHCGVLEADGSIDLAASLEALSAAAVTQARAGADLVGPSDMMDGHVAAIRSALDSDGRDMTGIISYAAKYASSFYGPFRDAADSTPSHGDRRGYQIHPGTSTQAIASIRRDLEEGADAVIVKPALPYLDVIARTQQSIEAPVWAYQVSGEYAMIRSGAVDERAALVESLTAIRRAGADVTITYGALDMARWLNDR